MRVSIQQIKDELMRHVNEHTSYSADFDSVEDAINHYTKELHNEINDFHTLTQEDIDNQNKQYSDDYLFGVKVGDLVWAGDSEVFLSLSNIEDCLRDADERMNDDYNAISDIARYVKFYLIAAQL